MLPPPTVMVATAMEGTTHSIDLSDNYFSLMQTTSKPQSQPVDNPSSLDFGWMFGGVDSSFNGPLPSEFMPSEYPDLVGTPTLSYSPHQSPASISTTTPKLLVPGDKTILPSESHEIAGVGAQLSLVSSFPSVSEKSISANWPMEQGWEETTEGLDSSLEPAVLASSDIPKLQGPTLLTEPLTYSSSATLPQAADPLYSLLSNASFQPSTFLDPSQAQVYPYQIPHPSSQFQNLPTQPSSNFPSNANSFLPQQPPFTYASASFHGLIQSQVVAKTNSEPISQDSAALSYAAGFGLPYLENLVLGSTASSKSSFGHHPSCPCCVGYASLLPSTISHCYGVGLPVASATLASNGLASYGVPASTTFTQPLSYATSTNTAVPLPGPSGFEAASWIAQQQHQYQQHVEVEKKSKSADTMLWAKQARALVADPSPEYIQSLFEVTPPSK
ncbi:hypothetical protein FRC02_009990 [Tulasnella sp. 418]|nr:hypothetical protein FRC02_009990 [Tulasnella sp. 418]